MEQIKNFLKTTVLGGFLVIMPIIVLIFVMNWLFDTVTESVKPIINIITKTARLDEMLAAMIAVFIILLLCFIVGLILKTNFGTFIYHFLERSLLKKIPGYKIIKETTIQLFGTKQTLFSSVALVNVFGNETLVTGFITAEHEDGSYTVFVPSGPAPTAGFVYHVPGKYVTKIDFPLDLAMKNIISVGSGSEEMINIYRKTIEEKQSGINRN